jgi:hypothetical protein
MESLLLAGCASHNNKDERGINAEPTSDEEQIPSRRLRNGEDEDYEGGDSKSKYYGCEDYRDENDLEAESYDRPEFHILTIANGETRLCTDCYLLIVAIQRRVGPTPMRWKTLRQLLSNGAFRHCQLCSLVASAPTIYMVPSYVDNMFSPRPLREHQMLFVDYPKIAKPESTSNPHVMEVVGHVDAANRICEISFRFKFFERYGEVVLAVWLGMSVIDSGLFGHWLGSVLELTVMLTRRRPL